MPKKKKELTHFDAQGNAVMVDVSAKASTAREAVAKGSVVMQPETLRLINTRKVKKGDVLVVAQLTISLVVLICAGLFIRSLGKAQELDPGFKTDNLVTMMVNLDLLAYDQQATLRFFPELWDVRTEL